MWTGRVSYTFCAPCEGRQHDPVGVLKNALVTIIGTQSGTNKIRDSIQILVTYMSYFVKQTTELNSFLLLNVSLWILVIGALCA